MSFVQIGILGCPHTGLYTVVHAVGSGVGSAFLFIRILLLSAVAFPIELFI